MLDTSECSVDSGQGRRCRCGMIATQLTAKTDNNFGRRFYKCPHNGVSSCGYWEWRDDFSPQASSVIAKLRNSLNVVCEERDTMKKMINDIRATKSTELAQMEKIRDEAKRMKIIILLSWAFFAGYVVARMV